MEHKYVIIVIFADQRKLANITSCHVSRTVTQTGASQLINLVCTHLKLALSIQHSVPTVDRLKLVIFNASSPNIMNVAKTSQHFFVHIKISNILVFYY